MSPTNKARLRYRLQNAALEETDAVVKQVRRQYPELKSVQVQLEDLPSRKMIAAGLPPETESTYIGDEKVVMLFLLNIYEQAGRDAKDYRARLRRVLLTELGDLMGMEIASGEE